MIYQLPRLRASAISECVMDVPLLEHTTGSSSGSPETGPPRDAANADYRDKTAHEISRISRRMRGKGHPIPPGDPTSGVVLVVEQPVGSRVPEAPGAEPTGRGAPEVYLTYAPPASLRRSCSPSTLMRW